MDASNFVIDPNNSVFEQTQLISSELSPKRADQETRLNPKRKSKTSEKDEKRLDLFKTPNQKSKLKVKPTNPQFYNIQTLDLLTTHIPDESTSIFPRRALESPKQQVLKFDEKEQHNYIYHKDRVYRHTPWYLILEVTAKTTNSRKIAKIYRKDALAGNIDLVRKIKTEVTILDALRGSRSILTMEKSFETSTNIYLIFEFGELLDEETLKQSELEVSRRSYKSSKRSNSAKKGQNPHRPKKKLKRLLCQILTAVNEINSFQLSVCFIDLPMIVKVAYGNFKLFNFSNLTPYEEPIQGVEGLQEDVQNLQKLPICTQITTKGNCIAGPETDSFAFGVLMARLYRQFTPNLQQSETNFRFLNELVADSSLDACEKDLFMGMLNRFKEERLKVFDIMLHSYFLEILKNNDDLLIRTKATYGRYHRINLVKLVKSARKRAEDEHLTLSKSIFESWRHSIEDTSDVATGRPGGVGDGMEHKGSLNLEPLVKKMQSLTSRKLGSQQGKGLPRASNRSRTAPRSGDIPALAGKDGPQRTYTPRVRGSNSTKHVNMGLVKKKVGVSKKSLKHLNPAKIERFMVKRDGMGSENDTNYEEEAQMRITPLTRKIDEEGYPVKETYQSLEKRIIRKIHDTNKIDKHLIHPHKPQNNSTLDLRDRANEDLYGAKKRARDHGGGLMKKGRGQSNEETKKSSKELQNEFISQEPSSEEEDYHLHRGLDARVLHNHKNRQNLFRKNKKKLGSSSGSQGQQKTGFVKVKAEKETVGTGMSSATKRMRVDGYRRFQDDYQKEFDGYGYRGGEGEEEEDQRAEVELEFDSLRRDHSLDRKKAEFGKKKKKGFEKFLDSVFEIMCCQNR